MVEIFKTNVSTRNHADRMISVLLDHLPGSRINFDLLDCDNVLRVEAHPVPCDKIIQLLHQHGFDCEPIE